MNKEGRVQYVMEMYQKINPNEEITSQTKIKGTTIEKLCEFDAGGYQRVKMWCEDKLNSRERDSEIEIIAKEFQRCFQLMKSRNEKYGNSWKVLSVPSIANLIEMKMNRIAKLGAEAPKTEDELMDSINYAIFALLKFTKKI